MRKRLLLFFVFFLVLLVLPVKALAQSNFRSREVVLLEKEEVVNDNYFAAGELVNVVGTVNGDAYLAGGNLIVEGTVNGDVLAAGGNITIKGNVTGNVRVAGGQINISGTVGRNITAVGGQITILDNAEVGGSLTVAGGNIEVNAPLGGSMNAAGGSLNVANTIPGNLNYAGDKLRLSSNAAVIGDLNYFSEKDAQISKSASVSGTVVKHSPPKEAIEARESAKRAGPKLMSLWTVISFVSALILGYFLTRFLPNFTIKVGNQIKNPCTFKV